MTAAAAQDHPGRGAPSWVRLGRFGRPRGLGGEVWFTADNPASPTLRTGLVLRLDGADDEVEIRGVQRAKGRFVLRLVGVNDRTAAEALRGSVARGRRADFAPLPEGEYYHVDLLGLEVVDDAGRVLGTVAAVQDTPAHDVLVVAVGGREVLVPVVEEWVGTIDVAAGRLELRRSEGLVE